MIKAFGYGVGSYEIAKLLEQQGIDYIAAALTDEGKEPREKGIHAPIIIKEPRARAFGQMIVNTGWSPIYLVPRYSDSSSPL